MGYTQPHLQLVSARDDSPGRGHDPSGDRVPRRRGRPPNVLQKNALHRGEDQPRWRRRTAAWFSTPHANGNVRRPDTNIRRPKQSQGLDLPGADEGRGAVGVVRC